MANFSPETPTITTTVLASTSTVPVAPAAVDDDNAVDDNTFTSPDIASTMATFQTPAPPNAYFRRAAPQLPSRTLSSNVSSLHSSSVSSVPILPRESPTVGLLGGIFADNSNTTARNSVAGTDCGVVFKLPPRRPRCGVTSGEPVTTHSRTSSSSASSSNRTGNGCNSIDDLGVLLDQQCTPIGRYSLSVPTTIATTLVDHNKNKKRSVDEEDTITTPSVVFHDCDDYDGKNLPLMNLDMIMEEENEEQESDYNDNNAQQQLEQDDDSKAPELEIINNNQTNPKVKFRTTNEVLKSDSRFNVQM